MIPKDDETLLGRLLVIQNLITPEELAFTLLEQQRYYLNVPLGKLLVNNKFISQITLSNTLEQQRDLRSGNKMIRAKVMVNLATDSCAHVVQSAINIKARSAHIRKQSTGRGYPIVTDDMLTKGSK